MKRLSLIVVSSILAVAVLFGSLMGQTNIVHAASISDSTQSLNALVAKVELHVHVVNHHATIDSQLQAVVSQKQFQLVQQAVNTYNSLTTSATNVPPVLPRHPSNSQKVRPSFWEYCYTISNATMDYIAWQMILGGSIFTIEGILIALVTGPGGAAISIGAVLIGFGGGYLLWYSDKYWPNGSFWCADSLGNVYWGPA